MSLVNTSNRPWLKKTDFDPTVFVLICYCPNPDSLNVETKFTNRDEHVFRLYVEPNRWTLMLAAAAHGITSLLSTSSRIFQDVSRVGGLMTHGPRFDMS